MLRVLASKAWYSRASRRLLSSRRSSSAIYHSENIFAVENAVRPVAAFRLALAFILVVFEGSKSENKMPASLTMAIVMLRPAIDSAVFVKAHLFLWHQIANLSTDVGRYFSHTTATR